MLGRRMAFQAIKSTSLPIGLTNNTLRMDNTTRQENDIFLNLEDGELQFTSFPSETMYLYVKKNIIEIIRAMKNLAGTIKILQNIIATRNEKDKPVISVL